MAFAVRPVREASSSCVNPAPSRNRFSPSPNVPVRVSPMPCVTPNLVLTLTYAPNLTEGRVPDASPKRATSGVPRPDVLRVTHSWGVGAAWGRYGWGVVSFINNTGNTGTVRLACNSNNAIFTLPQGYRPAGREVLLSVSNDAPIRVNVDFNGGIYTCNQTRDWAGDEWVSLDGLSFRAAN